MRVLMIVIGSAMVLWAVGVHAQVSNVNNPGVRGTLMRWAIWMSPSLSGRVHTYESSANLALLIGSSLILMAALWPLAGHKTGPFKSPSRKKLQSRSVKKH